MDYRIAHELPGRLRLRCAPGSFSQDRAHDLVARIVAVDGVAEAHATVTTGSVLVRYTRTAARGEVLSVVDGFVAGGAPRRRSADKAGARASSGNGGSGGRGDRGDRGDGAEARPGAEPAARPGARGGKGAGRGAGMPSGISGNASATIPATIPAGPARQARGPMGAHLPPGTPGVAGLHGMGAMAPHGMIPDGPALSADASGVAGLGGLNGLAMAGAAPGAGGLIRYLILRPFLPRIVRMVSAFFRALPFLLKGGRSLASGRLNVDVLDAAALGISLVRGDFRSVGLITALFAVGEFLEEWTRKKSRESLAESLAVDVDTVWVKRGEAEVQVPLSALADGDLVVVRAGSSIPVDGVVAEGEAMVNQTSMTGEPLAVARRAGASVYAGTVVEEGRLDIRPTGVGSETRINQIVGFIERSEALKANVQGKAERLADAIVPYSFLLAGGVWAVTRDVARAASVLLVDYSCAIRLATPLAILTGMREGAHHGVLIKGGRFIEGLAGADTVVFDKTGTLTEARPRVAEVISLNGHGRDDVLRLAACLEEHFPHPVARAVVRKAEQESLDHQEEHAEVEYVVAHGIASRLRGKRVLVGSRHFVHEDEGVPLDEFLPVINEWAAKGYSILHLAIGGKLAGILCIEDPLRTEAAGVVRGLREQGVKRIIMLTGDGPVTAAAVANAVGVDEWRAQVLPADKADIVRQLQAEGGKVVMVGDGINDSPALSAADVGVSLRDGADLAREVADVVLSGNDLAELLVARQLAKATLRRIHVNFGSIMGLNSAFMALGLVGRAQPGMLALLHNLTTVGVALNAMRPMLGNGAAEGRRGAERTPGMMALPVGVAGEAAAGPVAGAATAVVSPTARVAAGIAGAGAAVRSALKATVQGAAKTVGTMAGKARATGESDTAMPGKGSAKVPVAAKSGPLGKSDMSGKVAPSAKDGAKPTKPVKSAKSAKSGKSAKTTDETGSAKGGARATGKAARKTGGSGTA
ncbi:heavy metal translocating P-type ATPase [Nitratidesulfovibrio sp. SRB-5]|uniref:heavy metal translocating P-type ATPase n=1 Tax=Nitratidesulfovibrio sp. SRB-5 TaxID=2872636 RepID=UPI001CBF215D|nr:heavy metal translocating P-type ATPase [Nitratidesulfovibrio sp. SRB-5]MBZ2172428.1 heavy metal translocating P-type ATPase [Nitratidesulfovibrio sp. SRB-5]